MPKKTRKLRAIDLYSGVGGWALGLRLAGIEVVASYERWGAANETNFKNNHHQSQTVDIRGLGLDELPKNIDIVVGSPPCTQFSYSNRGGSGDIEEGLQDIIRFLTIVDHLKPKAWAMENVPRVARILGHELKRGGCLWKFRHLNISSHVVNMEDFGVPQRRRRCIAGNFNFELVSEYSKKIPSRTLGQVIKALAASRGVKDPIYGISVPKMDLVDHVIEEALNEEEVRINRASKMTHPVYNSMKFPDSLNRSVRTITATCTRVSRESIVIESPDSPGAFRRLTVRERACLQGFPITFQFYASSYSQKLRMVGNAIPPAFTYFVAQAFRETVVDDLPTLQDAARAFVAPIIPPVEARPDKAGARYPMDRTFRFAIPSLRLKSGVRFELSNSSKDELPGWAVAFYFGSSKSIHSLQLNASLFARLLKKIPQPILFKVNAQLNNLNGFIKKADVAHMQLIWSHNGVGCTRPFMLLDQLDETGAKIAALLDTHEATSRSLVANAISAEHGQSVDDLQGLAKLERHAPLILSGLLVGSAANMELNRHTRHMHTTDTRKPVKKRLA